MRSVSGKKYAKVTWCVAFDSRRGVFGSDHPRHYLEAQAAGAAGDQSYGNATPGPRRIRKHRTRYPCEIAS
ncbi:hypothetical protein EVAR_46706_1 [Eumeta japonica]|uniref:Uncharacterized protein n=1 Tax=Eumeta variegata TaxID=151549 RepID=A0A4C1X9L0_EUMVA|nr:hypothetical protein EVAR_46706_1 [Eumeta japonica]